MIVKTNLPDIPLNAPAYDFLRAVKERIEKPQPVELPTYTVQELNLLTKRLFSGMIVRCSNGDAGSECLAYCDGFNWKVIDLGGNISLT